MCLTPNLSILGILILPIQSGRIYIAVDVGTPAVRRDYYYPIERQPNYTIFRGNVQ